MTLLGILLLGVGLFCLLEALVLLGGRSRAQERPDAVVVLGAKLWGEQPSPALRNRLDTAAEYLLSLEGEGCTPVVVVTGGQGGDEVISEAQCMGDYLMQKGIPEERICREDKSTNTAENLKNTKALLDSRGITVRRVTFVTNYFHLTRVRMLARRLTPDWDCAALGCPVPDARSAAYSYCREALALVKSFLFDK